MDLPAIEALVSERLAALDLQVSGRLIDGDPTVQVVDSARQPPQLLAVISDHRTDRFSLRLGDLEFQDFAYQPADQALLVGSFCEIVAGYLRGEGTYGRTRPLLGFIVKGHQTYSIEIGGVFFTAIKREPGALAT